VTGTKHDASFSSLKDVLVDLSILVEQGNVSGVKAGVDIARAHMFQQLVV